MRDYTCVRRASASVKRGEKLHLDRRYQDAIERFSEALTRLASVPESTIVFGPLVVTRLRALSGLAQAAGIAGDQGLAASTLGRLLEWLTDVRISLHATGRASNVERHLGEWEAWARSYADQGRPWTSAATPPGPPARGGS